jgi:CO/xanthine dehydrogenase FAD-binding subunit
MIRNFAKPRDLEELIQSIKDDNYTIIAGGTDLMVEIHNGKEPKGKLIDVSTIKALKGISQYENCVTILAGTTHTEVLQSEIVKEKLPMLAKACSLVGSSLIRNRGTIGGNIANNANCADSIPPLLISDAVVCLKSFGRDRIIKLEEFLEKNSSVDIQKGEVLYSVTAKSLKGYKWNLIKVGRRKSLAISRLTLAIALKEINGIIEDLRICPGAMLSKQTRLHATENKFKGEKLSECIEAIADSAALEVIALSGRRWSTEYKEPVLRGLIIRTLEEWGKQHEAGL